MANRNIDQEIVKRVQAGDKDAFGILVRKYETKIVQLISRYIHDVTESQDVAQEAFIKAYRALPNFRGESAFYTWLYRIAINTAKNHLVSLGRKQQNIDLGVDGTDYYDSENAPKEYATPENLLSKDEVEKTVFEAIEQLPQDLRTAITLRELEGLSYEEIAEAMGCPVGTVRSRIFRAREAIDQKLKPLIEN